MSRVNRRRLDALLVTTFLLLSLSLLLPVTDFEEASIRYFHETQPEDCETLVERYHDVDCMNMTTGEYIEFRKGAPYAMPWSGLGHGLSILGTGVWFGYTLHKRMRYPNDKY